MATKRRFFDSIGAQMRELEEEIDKLDEKSRAFEDKLKEEFSSRADEFHERVGKGENGIDAFAKVTGAEVERLRDNLAHTAKALKKGYDRFRDEMRDK